MPIVTVWLILFTCFTAVYSLTCPTQGVLILGKTLDVESLFSVGYFGPKQCLRLCERISACLSYSYFRSEHKCVLYEADTSTQSLIDNSDAVFQEKSFFITDLLGPCGSVSCPSDSECVPLLNGPPVCVISGCSTPPGSISAASFTAVKTVYRESDTISYVCDEGFAPSGNPNVSCTASGEWTQSDFSCQGCPSQTPSLANGAVTAGSATIGTVRTYACNSGYTSGGSNITITCTSSATWSSLVGTCSAVDCGQPPSLSGGSIDSLTTTTFPVTRTYACDTGYTPNSGSGTISCQASGTWSSLSLTCTIVDCGEPTVSDPNGVVNSGCTTYECSRMFSCAIGYNIGGSVFSVTCQATGSWTGSSYSCTIVDCGEPTVSDPNGVVNSGCTTYECSRTFSCATGYNIGGSVFSVTCQATGSWTGSSYSCTNVDCGEPTVSEPNGVVNSGCTTYGCSRTFSCATGYNIGGSVFSVTCQATGSWTGSSYSCTIVDCGEPTVSEPNGVVNSGCTTYGCSRTFSCATGYNIGGSVFSVTCQATGSWTGSSYSCTNVDCGEPTVSEANGVVNSGCTTYGCSRTFSCATGYNIGGSVFSVTCQATGSWTGSSYSCTIVDCGEPTVSEPNGVVNSGCTTYGCSRTFSCATGYNFGGSVFTVTCQATGTWTGSSYSCTIVDCGEPTVSEPNGVVNSGCTTYGCSRTFSCATGYNIGGSVFSVTCQATGSWTGSSYSCTPAVVTCPAHPIKAYAKISGSGTSEGSTITYTCDDGAILVSGNDPSTSTCNAQGAWSTANINCAKCSTYASTYTQRTDRFFNPPVSFTPSISGGSVTASYCANSCNTRSDFVCVAYYYRKSTGGYCILRPMRVHDDVNHQQYDNADITYDEYIRECVVPCPDPPHVAYTSVSGTGSSRTYTCDTGAILSSGTDPATSTCTSGTWSSPNIVCSKCSTYASTYTQRTDRFFNPPVSFTPSISGGSVTASYCANSCNTRSDFVCVAYYYRKSTGGYCILRPMRVHDDVNHQQYDNADITYDEYIRDCA